jgi:hypothetical protein
MTASCCGFAASLRSHVRVCVESAGLDWSSEKVDPVTALVDGVDNQLLVHSHWLPFRHAAAFRKASAIRLNPDNPLRGGRSWLLLAKYAACVGKLAQDGEGAGYESGGKAEIGAPGLEGRGFARDGADLSGRGHFAIADDRKNDQGVIGVLRGVLKVHVRGPLD